MPDLTDILAEAYHRDQVQQDRPGAITLLRELNLDEAREERERLSVIVAAREQNGAHGCHVNRILKDLLDIVLV